MGTIKIKPFRKNENGSLDKILFSSSASYVDMEGFVRYTDAQLSGNIPAIDTAENVLLAFKYLDGATRKALNTKANANSLATVATSGSYLDLLNTPSIPSKVSDLTNDAGYITGVAWNDVTDKPNSFNPSAHFHTTSDVSALTGYTKAASASEITASDSLNVALGKIQKTLDAKQNSADAIATAVKASKDGAGNVITETYATKQEVSGIPKFKIEVVQSLPATGDAATIYLLSTGDETQNIYTEYIYVNNAWEKLGTQTLDLSAYALRSEIPTKVSELTNDAQYVITGEKVASATVADSATSATKDSRNQQIDSTYIKSISIEDTTVTITKGDGTTSTVSTKDTTYGPATTNELGLVKIGANITNNNGSLSLSQSNITSALGYTPPQQDTTYGIATSTTPGLMDTTDRTKLDNIEAGANNYVLPAATVANLGGVKVGDNITLANDGTISLGGNNVTAALGYTPPQQDTTYDPATTTTNGLMSAADKVKLNGIATGANKYVLPAASSSSLGGVIVGSNISSATNGTISLTKANVTSALGYTPPQQDTTYTVATTTADGLMSSTDKSKLNGIENGANNYTLPAANSTDLGGVKVGGNISVGTDGTISLTKANVTSALGYTPPTTNTTYATMTASEIEAGTDTTGKLVSAKVVGDFVSEQVGSLDTGVMSVATGSANGTISVDGSDVSVKGLGSAAYTASTAYAAASHNQASNTINAMTGYAKASTASAIATSDTLNTAIGKLEKALDGKQASGNYAAATHSHKSSEVTAMTSYAKPSSTSAIATSDSLNTAIGKLEKALDGKQAAGNYLAANGTAVKATADASGNVITDTYATKQEVSAIPKFKILVVDSLPTTGDAATIYLVVTGDESQNLYTEYIYVNNAWEKLGTQTVDLSAYALKTEIPSKVSELTNDLNFVTPSGTVNSAGSATKDSNNQTISSTYIKEISVSGTTLTLKKGNNTTSTINTQDTTYDVASTTEDGLMSSTDKSKLDGIANGANKYVLPAASASSLGGVIVGSNISVANDGTISLTKSNVTNALGYTPPTTNTTYSAITASELETGTATTSRVVTAKVISDYVTGAIGGIDTGVMSVATGSVNGTISVDGSDVSVKGLGSAAYTASTAYAASSHNQASSTINKMTGYEKASTASAIAATDTLNTAIGKLEKALDGKQASGNYLTTTGTAADSSKLGGVAAASYALKTDIPSNVSDFTNDAGYITGVAWGDIDNVPSTFAPSSHNQASNTINKMTGYSKPSSTSAIAASDTLNTAIGKLEKALDGKQASGSYAAANHTHDSGDVTAMTGYEKASTASAITTSDSLNTAIGKLEKALDGKQAAGSYAAASHNQASNTINAMTGYAKASSASAIAVGDSLNTAIGKLEKALDGKQASLSAMTASEATTGTATTARSITAKVLADYVASKIGGIDTGVMSVTTGSTNGTISVDGSDVAVYGLGSAAYTASTAYAAATHNHPSSQVNLMTGYSKPSSTSAIAASDTLNGAIGKLEKALDGKQATLSAMTASEATTGTATTARSITAKVLHDKIDELADSKIANNSRTIEFITGTQTAATPSFTGVSEDSELYDGKCINYYLPYAGTSAGDTLNLTLADGTTTGAKQIYLQGATKLTTHFAAGQVFMMTYSATKNAWYCGNYDSNSNTYDRMLHNNNIKAATAVTAGTIIVGSSAGYKMAASGVTFDITYPILYASTAIAANGANKATYDIMPGANMATTKSGWTGTQYATAYLVGTLSGVTFTIDSAVFTTTAPTSNDGKVYIPLGVMDTTTVIFFNPSKEIYQYTNGSFHKLDTTTAATGSANGTIAINGADVAVKGLASGAYAAAYSHPNSGVTADTYGPTANVTGTNNTTLIVPEITVNAQGHITGVTERTYTSKDTTYSAMTATEATTGTATTARTITAKVLADYVAAQIDDIDTGVMSITTGSSNGTISVDGTDVAVKGLASGAYTTAYTHPTGAGNNHIPSGGSSGQFLKWSASGVAVWAADNNTLNTAGSTNSASKLFLVGAASQAANPQTYSHSSVYETAGVLNATSYTIDTHGAIAYNSGTGCVEITVA